MPVFNQSRQTVIRLIIIAAFLVLLVRLFTLQVVSKGYQTQAMDNAVYKKVIYPDRGIIYDRKARPILSNTIIYDLMVTPAEVKNIDTAYLCNLIVHRHGRIPSPHRYCHLQKQKLQTFRV